MNISKLPAGKNPETGEVNVFIEIPEGSFIKYELDKDSGVMMVDRFAFTSMAFPANYGFIPQTLGEDGDPLDALVVATYPLAPGTAISSRVIGMLEMEDEAGIDTKIITVPSEKVDPFMAHIKDIADLDETLKKKIQHYFNHYKELEAGKWVKTKNFLSKKDALEAIKKALKK
ncbi:inorganic pyrophosphatase [Candidatus Roizmanbacteria bacterium RIFCSPLOWO2_12_FULL_40_12]|uniref:Inorganic pyrophosphatase n=1 Tax=Candidatus Roizmanbacteria bacterium RIFCSPLOWO2_01_FULL_40_42 TaxID=1802066 RepID=A0A1F7J5H1_9BACT|nr:MAG: inorganic pyrophosphatase [Candidatus Roizmanbacteria bacterium RIFCSPHIGHO2_01_FULL_40_98]OGK28292.1 MAG: inorganic pyrophosphatase [Candidatus Roizmanbacteria bacterium RIFCSPHIGHO2_02_FULL_40_53]OGK30528.1 MAG: inorganic pyrophosphatase [Candidatus Roizmanbacteria bacterium RIFCSPHIGHO2_12_41_18]OGK36942.1 MAG: inorganic pyrophosphatase [Candidatus Roizmanbacteria bacterium RIFCSPHIGHO2_12_FULL_40_130]OGK50848.1 MAG: inorganic pyrophosphatase [Candidatus Roizmanbacteria bacterium RIF